MEKVEVLSSELVVPVDETPRGSIWLSNLDLAGRRGYTSTVYFFHPNVDPGFFSTHSMKDSLARALVAFYPLAGRLGLSSTGRVEVDCTGEGVVFVTAGSEHYALEDLINEFVPCDAMHNLFVPPTPAPNPPCSLLFVQVTRLRCGGVVLGQAMHHSIVDARGAALFFETWASISRGAEMPPVPPCFDHTLLAARPALARAVLYEHLEYRPEQGPVDPVSASTYVSAIITMTKDQVDALKARCAGSSTFRAVVALAWQCVCRARALPESAETRLYSMVDMRARLEPPLPSGYFGNAVIRTSVTATVGEVVFSPVVHAARLVRATTNQGNKHARSLVDYLEGVDTMNLPRSGISSHAPPRYQLDGNVALGRGLRVGRAHVHGAGAHVLQWLLVRDGRAGEGRRPGARAVSGAREHAGVQEGVRRRARPPRALILRRHAIREVILRQSLQLYSL